MPKDKLDKKQFDYKSKLTGQRNVALAAINKNRVKTGDGGFRTLKPRERAAYQRVIKRADKVLGPILKPRNRGAGAKGLTSGLRVLKRFAEKTLAGKKKLGALPENTGK